MPVIAGQHRRSLTLDLPIDASLRHGSWSFSATLETPNAKATASVHDFGDGLLQFLQDVAESWRGWDGERHFQSLEGELAIVATHDGLGTETLDVRLSQPWPPTWRVEAELELGAGADLQGQVRDVVTWASTSK